MNSLEKLTEKFEQLPPLFQEAIRAFNYDKKLHDVAKKYKLHIDQLVHLEQIMSQIVFGEIQAHTLSSALKTTLDLDGTVSAELAIELNNTILQPLKDAIRHLHDEQEQTETPVDEHKTIIEQNL